MVLLCENSSRLDFLVSPEVLIVTGERVEAVAPRAKSNYLICSMDKLGRQPDQLRSGRIGVCGVPAFHRLNP